MKKLPYPLLALLLVMSLAVQAKESAPGYINPASIDWKTLLPLPPTDTSAVTKDEINLMLAKQESRTPEEVARIKLEASLRVYVFADVLGPWFAEKNLPVTAAFFKKVASDSSAVSGAAKDFYKRPRPPVLDGRLHPPIDTPTNPAYPSGHATEGTVFALILADMAPDLKDKLLARGKLIGEDRIIGGVHYPTDVKAGEMLGKVLYANFKESPGYKADFAKAKAEFDAARAKH